MSVPKLIPGLVICYSYLWARQQTAGVDEGSKNRPCAIVAAYKLIEGQAVATVVPVTHLRPDELTDAVEIPAAVKAMLGLDDLPSWLIVSETNEFVWPGPDLRPVARAMPDRFDYGMLPPRFFAHVRERIIGSIRNRKLKRVKRSQ